MDTQNQLLSRKEAADFLRISDRTLDRITGLPRIKLTERRVVFAKKDLLAWIEGRSEHRTAA